MRAERSAFAPGRVNLIGEHTDYNEGLALPFAIAQGIETRARALAAQRAEQVVEACAADLGERDRFALADPRPARGWRAFVRGVVAELRAAGFPLTGASVRFGGDVPPGAGLSSSAALEVSLCLALIALAAQAGGPDPDGLDRTQLARLCARVESEWLGAHTGLLDQLASLYGAADSALYIDFRTLAVEPQPLRLGAWTLAVLDSGERHAHASSGYNQRREECARASELLGVRSLRDASADAVEGLPEPLRSRALHVLEENERVREAAAALRVGDLHALGALLDASHASLRDRYEVSTAAVEVAVARMRDAGAAGARMIGGGFGGSVLGLFPPGARVPADARTVRPSPGARVLA